MVPGPVEAVRPTLCSPVSGGAAGRSYVGLPLPRGKVHVFVVIIEQQPALSVALLSLLLILLIVIFLVILLLKVEVPSDPLPAVLEVPPTVTALPLILFFEYVPLSAVCLSSLRSFVLRFLRGIPSY